MTQQSNPVLTQWLNDHCEMVGRTYSLRKEFCTQAVIHQGNEVRVILIDYSSKKELWAAIETIARKAAGMKKRVKAIFLMSEMWVKSMPLDEYVGCRSASDYPDATEALSVIGSDGEQMIGRSVSIESRNLIGQWQDIDGLVPTEGVLGEFWKIYREAKGDDKGFGH